MKAYNVDLKGISTTVTASVTSPTWMTLWKES